MSCERKTYVVFFFLFGREIREREISVCKRVGVLGELWFFFAAVRPCPCTSVGGRPFLMNFLPHPRDILDTLNTLDTMRTTSFWTR